jgi:hypothetical protein
VDKSVHEKSPKSVHKKSPFDNVHEKSPILKKSVHEMSLSTKCLHPETFGPGWQIMDPFGLWLT